MTPKQQLEALADLFAPEIRDAFLLAIADIVDNIYLQQVIDAIEQGDPIGAFQALGFSDASLRPITQVLEKSFETGGIYTGRTFPKWLNTPSGRVVFRFDVRNSRAEKWLRDESSSLITRITDDIRVNVQNTLQAGMIAGRNPRNTALDIVGRIDSTGRRVGGVIGLTQQQELFSRNVRRTLEQLDEHYFKYGLRDARFDATVKRAIESGKPLPADIIDKLVNRYRDRSLKKRGDDIARTESMAALNAADYEATRQAVDMGAVSESAVQREWDSAGDNRVRFTHRKMNGQRVGLLEPFISPSGARLMHPHDTSLGAPADEVVGCRCRVRQVIDWLADAV